MSLFPDPRTARGDIVAFGNDLSVDTLRDAYRHGIFPWPHDTLPLPWFSPRRRGVLIFDELHIGKSLQKAQRRSSLTFTVDRAFEQVIRACSDAARPEQDGTWIGEDIIAAYTALHRAGDAHSFEAWQDGQLVGGLYGVDAGVFTGESMFHRQANASKMTLLYAIGYLQAHGSMWLDCQVITPHMAALGARLVSRSRFLDMLAKAQASGDRLF